MTTPEIKPETVNHPSHYQTAGQGRDGNIECIDVIEAYGIMYSFTLGNAVKYLWRAGSKGDLIADLRKARWYLDRWLEKEGAHPSPDYEIPDEMTPEKVIAALGLTGYRADLLLMILTDIYADEDTSDAWLEHLDAAITEAGGNPDGDNHVQA